MDLDLFEGIRKYDKNICSLRMLVDVLQKTEDKLCFDRPAYIPEIIELDTFSETHELIPEEMFSPRWIIEYMIETHGNTVMTFKNSLESDRFVYKYNSGDEYKEYIFSNNMMFYEDVITICYLYWISLTAFCNTKFCPLTHLYEIMTEKYNICTTKDLAIAKSNNSKKVTLFKIAYSFPSITFMMLHHNIVETPLSLSTKFSDFNLPKVLYLPLISSIIPVLDPVTPLILLLAIAVFNDKFKLISLYEHWRYTHNLYTSKAFPINLKLQICEKLGIVHMIEGEYKFAPYFEASREVAEQEIFLRLEQNLKLDQKFLHSLFYDIPIP